MFRNGGTRFSGDDRRRREGLERLQMQSKRNGL
jgi:hypothetical protein